VARERSAPASYEPAHAPHRRDRRPASSTLWRAHPRDVPPRSPRRERTTPAKGVSPACTLASTHAKTLRRAEDTATRAPVETSRSVTAPPRVLPPCRYRSPLRRGRGRGQSSQYGATSSRVPEGPQPAVTPTGGNPSRRWPRGQMTEQWVEGLELCERATIAGFGLHGREWRARGDRDRPGTVNHHDA